MTDSERYDLESEMEVAQDSIDALTAERDELRIHLNRADTTMQGLRDALKTLRDALKTLHDAVESGGPVWVAMLNARKLLGIDD